MIKLPENKRNVPSVFTCLDGTKVLTSDLWFEKRRPEILKLFLQEEYGCLPDMSQVQVQIRLADSRLAMEGRALRNTVEVETVRNGIHFSFPFVVFIPVNAVAPSPAFITICNRGIRDSDPARHFLSPFLPAETIISRGYACAAFRTQEVSPDYDEGFTTGFYKLFPEYAEKAGNRPDHLCGAIGIWAWAASRIMDYFETEALVDEKRVAVVGHSRGGKTALWCSAQDERFAMAVSSCAGNSGDAISRGSQGETIKDIVDRFPYWFCKNYRKYKNREEELPFDQHMLLSLIAPRLVYTSSKTLDKWADPKGQFESCIQASPVYQLLGEHGISSDKMPLPEQTLHEGNIGHHHKTGTHDMDEYDWNCYMDFADRHMR